ncbi:GNAT family N-acetyltransferase [Diaminobutyricimonas sp. LJ205]|uniref:GNAT family N-acetyltransferase n=1 Tax=Diaminobutyricimonas sp. LJ205 TaxID=2683590 RepID=UPI0012F4D542|nr:GNAT family N-acetyltransferase [Diaminobutyricimonas sp. LJ205]
MSMSPLNERVVAPDVTAVPTDAPGLRWRPAVVDDVDAVTALYKRMAKADHPQWSETREEVASEFGHPWVDLARDSLLAETAGGELVAFGQVVLPPAQETLVRSILFGGVDPAHRGRTIGRQLLGWQYSRALQQLAASAKPLPGWVMAYTDERNQTAQHLYERFELTPARYFVQLERVVADPIDQVALPDGVSIVPYVPDMSEAVRRAKNAAFQDHWGSQPSTKEQWQRMLLDLPSFRPDLSFVAVVQGEVIGLVISEVFEHDWEAQGFRSGYISLVGVVREWRRRGIAPALLGRVLESYRAAWFDKAQLDVDTDNPTGALRLYTGMGFTPTTREVSHTRVF